MGKLFIKDSGTWKQVQKIFIKNGGTWQTVGVGSISVSGSNKQFYPDILNTVTYYTGSGTFTVPAGVTSLSVTMIAGGGSGNGGDDWGSGGGGSGGYYQNYIYYVTPGSTISYSVGAAGANTTFGSLTCTAGGNAPSGTTGGSGGSPGGTAGQNGNQSGSQYPAIAGKGADSPFGTGGAGGVGGGPHVTGNPGSPGTGFGSGGGGGGNNASGGLGAPGFIKIVPTTTVAFGDLIINATTSTRSGASYSFTVPANVYRLTVSAAGGGGGAYAYHGGGYDEHAWAGGPGGGIAGLIIPVVPGDVISGVYGSAGGCGYYNGGTGGSGSATTINKNGALVATCGAGGNGNTQPPSVGTSTIQSGYSGTTTIGTAQQSYLNTTDGTYPYANKYDPWSWVLGGDPSYPQSVLGTVATQAPSILGANYAYGGMPQVCGWVSITY
jgi:hypothetical protein